MRHCPYFGNFLAHISTHAFAATDAYANAYNFGCFARVATFDLLAGFAQPAELIPASNITLAAVLLLSFFFPTIVFLTFSLVFSPFI